MPLVQEVLSKETRDAMMLDLPDPIPEYDSLTSIDWKRIPVRTLAEHICHIEYQLFRRIRPRELLGCRWSKKNGPEVSPNVRNMIDWFNKVRALLSCTKALRGGGSQRHGRKRRRGGGGGERWWDWERRGGRV